MSCKAVRSLGQVTPYQLGDFVVRVLEGDSVIHSSAQSNDAVTSAVSVTIIGFLFEPPYFV